MKRKKKSRLSRWVLGEGVSFGVLLLAVSGMEAELHVWNVLLALLALAGMAVCAAPLRYHPARARKQIRTVARVTASATDPRTDLRAA